MARAFFKRGASLLGGATAAALVIPRTFPVVLCEEPRTRNKVLGDENLPPSKRRHRVGLASWTHTGMKPGVHGLKTLSDLFDHAKDAGYDGLEAGLGDLRAGGYVPKDISDAELTKLVKKEVDRTGVTLLGALYLVVDGNEKIRDFDLCLRDAHFKEKMRKQIRADKNAGCEYITYQIFLPDNYLNTGGAYRDDDKFIALSAKRCNLLQELCFEEGLNCYVETHVDRITEDMAAFIKILDHPDCPDTLELNGDLSHYIYRGWTKGPYIEKLLSRLGHTHQRMARVHGDLSSEVENLKKDWELDEGSVTQESFNLVKKALSNGLTSRAVVGEAGPIHLVKNSLATNDRLVPLFKFMACWADQKCTEEVDAKYFF